MPGAEWFPGAKLNYAEHVFAAAQPGRPAIVHRSEARGEGELSWEELRSQVARAAAGLRALGVEKGDRVVAYMPNVPETVVAFLATASIGAIWSSSSPEFGARSVVDRFGQIEPKVLLAVDGYRYGGKDFDRSELVADLQRELPGLERTVLVPYLRDDAGTGGLRDAMTWEELLGAEEELRFEPVPFDHPLWVLYSSGTTGLPKAIVHGHGGILLEQLKKAHLHLDVHPGDRMFWFTTTGWMMWNFLVGTLLAGATIVLYDGNPGHPDLDALWALAEEMGVTSFGTSASYIAACAKAGSEAGRDARPRRAAQPGVHRLAAGARGVPMGLRRDQARPVALLDEWGHRPVHGVRGRRPHAARLPGGAPGAGAGGGGARVRRGGTGGDRRGGGAGDHRADALHADLLLGRSRGERYRESYFETFPGVWRHGDWIEITSRGTAVIYGRSDSTINRQGVRMGTSEIYRAVLALDEIADALVVDIPRPGSDGWMPLFVVLAEGVELDDDLRKRIARRIREDCSPRHVPNEVYAVAEVPRTLSGKMLEVPVKRILMGTPPERAASRDSLANPAALDWFAELAGSLDESYT